MTPKPDMPRYQVMKKSKSAHCCFEATVMDTTKPQNYSDDYGQHYEAVCECFSIEDAERVALALNRADLVPDTRSDVREALESIINTPGQTEGWYRKLAEHALYNLTRPLDLQGLKREVKMIRGCCTMHRDEYTQGYNDALDDAERLIRGKDGG